MTNIIQARFSNSKSVYASGLWRYDYGQILQFIGLELPTVYEVHFANKDDSTSITVLGNEDGVLIPDQFLQSGKSVIAWVFLHTGEDDGETEYRVIMPVTNRAKPSEDTPTPEEQSAITQAIAALNEAVESTGADAQSAQADADRAQSYAVGGTGTRTGEDTDNAKYYAELAAQSAEAAGYVQFDIDDSDGQMYVTVANNLDNDLTFAIDEDTGNLEVVIK